MPLLNIIGLWSILYFVCIVSAFTFWLYLVVVVHRTGGLTEKPKEIPHAAHTNDPANWVIDSTGEEHYRIPIQGDQVYNTRPGYERSKPSMLRYAFYWSLFLFVGYYVLKFLAGVFVFFASKAPF